MPSQPPMPYTRDLTRGTVTTSCQTTHKRSSMPTVCITQIPKDWFYYWDRLRCATKSACFYSYLMVWKVGNGASLTLLLARYGSFFWTNSSPMGQEAHKSILGEGDAMCNSFTLKIESLVAGSGDCGHLWKLCKLVQSMLAIDGYKISQLQFICDIGNFMLLHSTL